MRTALLPLALIDRAADDFGRHRLGGAYVLHLGPAFGVAPDGPIAAAGGGTGIPEAALRRWPNPFTTAPRQSSGRGHVDLLPTAQAGGIPDDRSSGLSALLGSDHSLPSKSIVPPEADTVSPAATSVRPASWIFCAASTSRTRTEPHSGHCQCGAPSGRAVTVWPQAWHRLLLE